MHYTIVCIFDQHYVDCNILHKTRHSDTNPEVQQDDTMSINKCAYQIIEKQVICITKQASDWSIEVSSHAKTQNTPDIIIKDTRACL